MEHTADNNGFIRVIRAIMVVVFCCVVLGPGLLMLVDPAKDVSETEKRKLAVLPEFRLAREFPAEFEAYVSDHLGFRSWLVLAHNYFLVEVFGTSPVDSVMNGRNGWLYYTGNRLRQDFMGKDPFSEAMLLHWENVLKERIEYLGKKGIGYLLVAAPNKQSIYPENMPGEMREKQGRPRLDQLKQHLLEKKIHCLVDLRPALMAAKTRSRLYYVTDTHWNTMGALIACEQISQRLEKLFPGELFLDTDAITMVSPEEASARDLATMVGLARVLKETEPLRMAAKEPCSRPIDSLTLPHVGDKYYEIPFARGCSGRTRKAIVFRDSFTNFLEPFLSEMFETVIYIWKRYDPEIMDALLKEFEPDIVIEESVERFLVTPPL